ncbi:MAG: A/G-specific adenine glycosylase [Gammaproteobacteria bacterium]|nr:A/G-specific adenine glycosylase [Gammaproteobacteria bacterium]
MKNTQFSNRLLAWFDMHGRKDLPWQHNPTHYRVWVSEVMLQQTQVATVIPYFQCFMARFPDVAALAAAPLDEVLHLWAGLGYYARARNLHRAAGIVHEQYGGAFPLDIAAVQSLPGIGRSTAAAILTLSSNQRHAILDGNVKRVLTRFHAIGGWPGKTDVEQALWDLAEQHTPSQRAAHYTQAIMDLGATLCTRAAPACVRCPLHDGCAAYEQGRMSDFPAPKPRKTLPVRATTLLMLRDSHDGILLVQRPPAGIWGGLWSFPECPIDEDIETWCAQHLGYRIIARETWPALRHTFSHFHLDITPVHARVRGMNGIMEGSNAIWYNPASPKALGLAAPVQRLLTQLSGDNHA